MKILVLLVLLLTAAPFSFSECDATISPSDTIGEVKKKLACLAAENLKMKQDLAQAQSQMTQWGINTYGIADTPPPIDTCKSKATASILKRGGAVGRQGENWIDLHLGSNAVVVVCQTDMSAFVAISGPDETGMSGLGQLLRSEIFLQ